MDGGVGHTKVAHAEFVEDVEDAVKTILGVKFKNRQNVVKNLTIINRTFE